MHADRSGKLCPGSRKLQREVVMWIPALQIYPDIKPVRLRAVDMIVRCKVTRDTIKDRPL
jgi:hypothetical protein